MHADMKSHTGMTITLGKGSIFVGSRKQCNTKNSTEAELVGISDSLSMIIWCREFVIYHL